MLWIFVSVLLIGCGLVSTSVYVGWRLTHPERRRIDDSPANYGLYAEEIAFSSRTGDVQLHGWFLPSSDCSSQMTILFSHGYGGTRLEKGLPALELAKSLVDAGYHVVMFDFRNSGQSEGDLTTVGYLEKQDVLGAIDWIREHTTTKIGLIGFSMGGSTSILAAAEEEAVIGVVADSPFSQLSPYLRNNLPVWSKLPRFPFTALILAILPRMIGISPRHVDALAAVDHVYPRPILFIHSQDDNAIPWTNSQAMWSKYPDDFELWITTKAPHVGTYKLQSEAYTKRVLAFFSKL
ncbi:alpha/beta hydrolase [Paenibacillus sp. SYP-B3998]|uniref:Alpha/beta hydrolase n=1 Tax=Paenibacillus sp. SYP-B3998 TaxID=2678564 RepID=A0A6G3ZT35_9BACL|nr:alpha/beta fold hydrolase [Paenibacillus sp. SYP-B3998]NEW05376.1 alpha/beta hydrolase [Paenibacillus sp. SYP-B3998]